MIEDNLIIHSLKFFSVIIAKLSQPYEIMSTIIIPILQIWKLKQSFVTSSSSFCACRIDRKRKKEALIVYSVSDIGPGKAGHAYR